MSGVRHNRGRSKQDYATPWPFIAAVKTHLDIEEFAVDLAAEEGNRKAAWWIDPKDDSLKMDWRHAIGRGYGWLNPPYASIGKWAKKCAETVKEPGPKICFLVPAAVGSNWFRDYVYRADAHTLFLNGRITFEGATDPYPKDLMLVLYGFGYQGNSIWSWRDALRDAA